MRRSLVRSTERSTKAAMWVERRKRNCATWRTISTSSSVRRKAGGSDARRNRGLRIGLSTATSMLPLYQLADTASLAPLGLDHDGKIGNTQIYSTSRQITRLSTLPLF